MPEPQGAIVHEESQRFASWTRWLLVGIALGDLAMLLLVVAPTGASPAEVTATLIVAGVVAVVVAAFLGLVMMGTRVRLTPEAVHARLGVWPVWSRWPLGEIVACGLVTYDPMRQFGGWGLRRNARLRTRLYSARGNRGVLLTLRSGRRILLGSNDPESLCLAVSALGVAVDPVRRKLS